jgi:Cu2+-exporting ATPase
VAAALERDSRHPLAQAFRAFDSGLPARAREVPGQGMAGEVAGRTWRIGRAEFAVGGTDDGALWLGDGVRAVARFAIEDHLRGDAAQTLAALRASGLTVELLSGDGEAAVARLGDRLGIDASARHARQTPEQKLARMRALQAAGRRVAMVGDGINDAPVLAGADVSFAVAEGAALAQRAADFVLTSPSLLRIAEARVLALRTQRVIRQNLAWALGYNVVALPLAAAGMVTPWIAAIGMALSSLTVTLNALRLARTSAREA